MRGPPRETPAPSGAPARRAPPTMGWDRLAAPGPRADRGGRRRFQAFAGLCRVTDVQLDPITEPQDDERLLVARALGLPHHHADEAAALTSGQDARKPRPQVGGTAATEL